MNFKYTLNRADAIAPQRSDSGSLGIDFFIPSKEPRKTILPGESVIIHTGVHVCLDENLGLLALNRSGIASKRNLYVGACLIDCSFQGEILINLTNVGNKKTFIDGGEKIIQFIPIPHYDVDFEGFNSLDSLYKDHVSERGSNGFGSTGV